MTEKKPFKIPISLLVLDFIGTFLFAIGVIDLVSETKIVPESFQFNNYEIVMIVCGVLLVIPFMSHIIKFSLGKHERDI